MVVQENNKICPICNNSFKITSSNKKQITCSKKCGNIWKSIKLSDDKYRKFKPNKNEFINNYNILKSSYKMAKIYKVHNTTILNYAKRIGYNTSQHKNNTPILDKKQVDYINNNYNTKSSTTLSKEINCSKELIKSIWKKGDKKGKTNYMYYSDFNYFKNINTPEKAYWLGFIYADGCVYKRNNHEGLLSITLKNTDDEIIKMFKNDIKSENPIIYGKCKRENNKYTYYVNFTIVSEIMFNDLYLLGCRPNKSINLNKLPTIDKKLMSHFIRGFFDGDGSIYKIKDKYIRYCFSIVGTSSFIKELVDYLNTKLFIKFGLYKDKRSKDLFSMRTTKRNSLKILYNYLYNDVSRYLSRKKKIFDKFLKEVGDSDIINNYSKSTKTN